MTEEQEREIRLSISEQELLQVLEALSEANLVLLAVKVNMAWLVEPKAQAAKIQRSAQFAEGLQTIRARLFNLRGYFEGTGYPVVALSWVDEAIEVVTSLRNKLRGNK